MCLTHTPPHRNNFWGQQVLRLNIDNRLRGELLNFSINGKPDSKAFTIYTRLLMTAQYEDNTVNGISLQCGQTLTSIRRLSADTGLTEKSVRIAVKHLIENGYIEQLSTKNYTIFTLCHYTTNGKDTNGKGDSSKQDKVNNDKQDREAYRKELRQKAINGTITDEEQEILNNWRD